MKLEKVYAEIIKARLKERKIRMGTLDENYYAITLDGYVMYCLPRSEFLLSLDTFLRDNELKDFSKLRPQGDIETADMSSALLMKQGRDGKMYNLVNLTNKYGSKYVNQALLKNFEQPAFKFAGGGYSTPVYVYENNNNLVGIVCPFIVNS